jgi:hypothetical protein
MYGNNCSLIKVDWLAAGIALRVVGAVVFSSGVGVKFAQSSSQWEARADTRRNVPNLAHPIRTKETWTKYTPLTLLSQRKLALSARNTLLHCKIIGAPKKLKKWLRTLFRPRTNHTCYQKQNPFRYIYTVPLKVHKIEIFLSSILKFVLFLY